jgi:hypothetical protein
MTSRRDLKNRIRARQSETGERYTTARQKTLARSVPVLELQDVPDAPGIFCPVRISPSLWASRHSLLDQLRRILLSSEEGLAPMRRVVLFGERDAAPRGHALALLAQVRAFRQQLEEGLRGPGPGGRMVAFDGGGAVVIAQLLPRHDHKPLLLLTRFGENALFESMERWPWTRL